MAVIHSFAPIAKPDAHSLILGSMPGKASLTAGEYYAHPRNAFWAIMGDLFGAGPAKHYAERCQILTDHGIAVWDVLKSCQRATSLDADIEPASMISNDFAGFLQAHQQIHSIYFNGGTAEQTFLKQVLPNLTTNHLQLVRLPSTSPAHATLSYAEKLDCWRCICQLDKPE